MGRLTEVLAPKGHKDEYSYLTPSSRTSPGATILKDMPVKHYSEARIQKYIDKVEKMHLLSHGTDGSLMFESVQIIRQLQEYSERLKDAIIREVDTMTAFAHLDDLCNDARFVKRLFLSVGDIVPELKALADEVDPLLDKK